MRTIKNFSVTSIVNNFFAGPLSNNSENLINDNYFFFCDDNIECLSLTQWQHLHSDPNFISNFEITDFDFFNPLFAFNTAKLAWIIGSNFYSFIYWSTVYCNCLGHFCNNFYNELILMFLPIFNNIIDSAHILYIIVMNSLFPDSFPPLPGRTPLARDTLLLFLIHTVLVGRVFSLLISLVLYLLKIFSFIVLKYLPHFTVKYLFLYNRKQRKFWRTTLSLGDTKKDIEIYNSYMAFRILIIKKTFLAVVQIIKNITISSVLILIIHTHPAWS